MIPRLLLFFSALSLISGEARFVQVNWPPNPITKEPILKYKVFITDEPPRSTDIPQKEKMDEEFYECRGRRWLSEDYCIQQYNFRKRMERLREERERLEWIPKLCIAVYVLCCVWLIIVSINGILKYLALRRSKRISDVRRTPTIPFPMEGLYEYNGDNKKKHVIPDVRILCSPDSKSYCTSKKFNKLMIDLFKLRIHEDDGASTRLGKKCPLPKNARVLSIKMNGFKHGEKMHEFEPIDGAAPGSSYEFQMLGDQKIQATYYVEGGVSYPAGYCIYWSKTGLRDEEFPLDVIRDSWNQQAQKYPGSISSAPMEEEKDSRQPPPPPYSTINIV